MQNHVRHNRLQLMDQTLTSMRDAGYDLNSTDIEFVWKAALGLATPEEIAGWTLAIAKKLEGRKTGPCLLLPIIQASADRLRPEISWLKQEIQDCIRCE